MLLNYLQSLFEIGCNFPYLYVEIAEIRNAQAVPNGSGVMRRSLNSAAFNVRKLKNTLTSAQKKKKLIKLQTTEFELSNRTECVNQEQLSGYHINFGKKGDYIAYLA